MIAPDASGVVQKVGTTENPPSGTTGCSKLPLRIKLAYASGTPPEVKRPTASQKQASALVRDDSRNAALSARRVVMHGTCLIFIAILSFDEFVIYLLQKFPLAKVTGNRKSFLKAEIVTGNC